MIQTSDTVEPNAVSREQCPLGRPKSPNERAGDWLERA
jgi:hypothetical protein